MRKLLVVFIVAVLAVPTAFADCNTAGSCAGGNVWPCQLAYNHLQNWNFDYSCDWSYSGAYRATDGQMCNGTFSSPGYALLEWRSLPRNSKVSQVVYIPAQGESGWFSNSTQWSVGYNLQFVDADLLSTNTFRVRVYDNGTNTLVASGTIHRGSDGDPWCNKFGFNFNADLNGKYVRVELYAVWAAVEAGDAFVAVDNVELNQHS